MTDQIKASYALTSDSHINEMAMVMFNEWVRVDPDSNVAKNPASYMANFADMARAVDCAQLQAAQEPTVEQAARVLWRAFVSDGSETNFKPAWNAWKHRIWACDGSIYSAMSAWLKALAESAPKSTNAEGADT